MKQQDHGKARFQTVDGETLMNRPYLPVNHVVDTLLGQGLHILAGAPKVGKSWLALWLCLQVSTGEEVWDLATKQGTVLYLCLEDNEPRIQKGLLDITDYAPSCLYFATSAYALGKGLEEQMHNGPPRHSVDCGRHPADGARHHLRQRLRA